MKLRVATFNIRNGRAFDGWHSWPFRRRATAAAARALDADVLGLQEVFRFQLRSLVKALPTHTAVGCGRSHRRLGEHCPVFVRRALHVVRHDTAWYGPSPTTPGERLPGASFPRIFTTAVVDVGDGRLVHVVNTHLDERVAANRSTALDQLLTMVDPAVPTVVLGDFNVTPDDPLLGAFAAAGFRAAVPDPPIGSTHDFTGRTDGRRLDHVFVSAHFDVAAAHVAVHRPGGRLPSDHWPVVADLTLRTAPAGGR